MANAPEWVTPPADTAEEIYTNGKYLEVPSLKGIIDPTQQNLSQLLSIKIDIPIDAISHNYYIETTKMIHRMGTYRSLDLQFAQYNKEKEKSEHYSPYSYPGYDFFASLVIGHQHFFNTVPETNFTDVDIDTWNKEGRSVPLKDVMENTFSLLPVVGYLEFKEHFKVDKNGIYRLFTATDPEDSEREDEGIGFTADELIFRATQSNAYSSDKENKIVEIRIPKDLILLYMQAFIDVNRSVSTDTTNLHVKKIQQTIAQFFQIPEEQRDDTTLSTILRRNPLT